MGIKRYEAAGGVVASDDEVLVLFRPSRDEIRLPKGHIDPGESAEQAALREVAEESGYERLEVLADLGEQTVRFPALYGGLTIVRIERYFLMRALDGRTGYGEWEFQPTWMSWDDAEHHLSYEPEREWVRRARVTLDRRVP